MYLNVKSEYTFGHHKAKYILPKSLTVPMT